MKETLHTCPQCRRGNFTASGLRSHRCGIKPARQTASTKTLASSPDIESAYPDLITEIITLSDDIKSHLRQSCCGALLVGLRLLALHRHTGDADTPGGFSAALAAMGERHVSRSTAYRWMNAASMVLCRAHDLSDVSDLHLPNSSNQEWNNLETVLTTASNGMSLRRLSIGWQEPTSDEARLDRLQTSEESGDPSATDMLEKVSRGELTLAQAIRGATGSLATKDKGRRDPVYLDLDSTTGQPVGLVPKCLVTLSNAFRVWDDLDESACISIRAAWKALVANLPVSLR